MKFPKPKHKKQPETISRSVRYLPDGREICRTTPAGREEYKRRREEAWRRDRGICWICQTPVSMEEVTADHYVPRGMGGAFRDDRIPNLKPAHGLCNMKRGSKRAEPNPAEPEVST